MKIVCLKCKIEQEEENFIFRKDTGNRRNICKSCRSHQNKMWKQANKKHVLSKSLEWQQKNREKCRDSCKKWASKNKPRIANNTALYNNKKRQSCPSWLSAIEKAQIQEFYDVAKAKEIQTGIKHHVDHIIPLRGKNVCGLHVPWNLQILTAAENYSKKNKVVEI